MEARTHPPTKVGTALSAASASNAWRTARIWIVLTCLVAFLVAVDMLYCWWVSPEHRIAQFVSASRREDYVAMLALADPAEVRHLGLTALKLNLLLDEAAEAPSGVELGQVTPDPLNAEQTLFNREVTVTLLNLQGQPIPGATPAFLYAYNTKSGWKIDISHFLYAVVFARTGHGLAVYRDLCVRNGVMPEVMNPTDLTWER